LAVLGKDAVDHARVFARDFVHELHRFENAQHLTRNDARANGNERIGAGRGGRIVDADHRRRDVLTFAGASTAPFAAGSPAIGAAAATPGAAGQSSRRRPERFALHEFVLRVADANPDGVQIVLAQNLGQRAYAPGLVVMHPEPLRRASPRLYPRHRRAADAVGPALEIAQDDLTGRDVVVAQDQCPAGAVAVGNLKWSNSLRSR